jgi:hypothetical protein
MPTTHPPPPGNEGAAAADTAGSREDTQDVGKLTATPAPAQPRKWRRVLRALVDGRTLNRFDAYRELRDSCLNTTISQLERRGVRISRRDETVPGAFGPVRCCRYRLSPESRIRALELLAGAP